MKTQPFPSALWKRAANCVWQIESILQCPLPSCAKLVSLPPFSCLRIVDTQVSFFFSFLLASQTQKESSDIYWAPSLFVFHLFLHHMSAFMSSLRRNIKEAHSLLILTMTIQSFRHTGSGACACTFYFKKSGYCHYFLNIPCLSGVCKVLHHAGFFSFCQTGQISRITLHKEPE